MMLLNNMRCLLSGHKYRVVFVMNAGARIVECGRCAKKWAMHDETRSFIRYDNASKEFKDDLKRIYPNVELP